MREIHEGYFVFIDETSFTEYQKIADGHIPDKGGRPFCFIVRDIRHRDIFWAIPISSQIDQYKRRAEKSPDKFKFYFLLGQEKCFNISCMIPILETDIAKVYQRNQQPVRIRTEDFSALQKHVLRILKTPDMWPVIMSQVNVEALYRAVEQRLGQGHGGESES